MLRTLVLVSAATALRISEILAGHYTGQAGGSGDVLGPTAKGFMDREKPNNKPHCLGDAFVLWAYCGLGQIECFEVSALK